MDRIRVALVDDHGVVRQGLRNYLESFADIVVVGTAASGEDALQRFLTWAADVAVIDLLMPGGIDGIETIRRARPLVAHTNFVVLTAYTDDARVIAALRSGAIGYVRKEAEPEVLLATVRAAARGQTLLEPAVAAAVMQHGMQALADELTARERQVLPHLARGRTNRQIAEALMVGEETVKTHVANILGKLHLDHRSQVVVYALKQGLVTLDELDQ